MENEIWMPVVGYEKQYEVSNQGRVKSFDRRVKCKNGSINFYKSRIMKPHLSTKGYHHIQLMNNGNNRKKYVHVLVAESFLGHVGCKVLRVVDHKDDNKLNNKLPNLQVITQRENNNKIKRGLNKFVGVSVANSGFRARITFDGKRKHLGVFRTEELASEAYQLALKIYSDGKKGL